MAAQRSALKQSIIQLLSCALQPENEIQRLTEERKKALEMTEDYAFILIEIIKSKEEAEPEQIMAATFLKNYLNNMYNNCKQYNTTPEFFKPKTLSKLIFTILDTLAENKGIIRELLLTSLDILLKNANTNDSHFMQRINNKVMSYLVHPSKVQVEAGVFFMFNMAVARRDNSTYRYFSPEYVEPLLNILLDYNHSSLTRTSVSMCVLEIWRSGHYFYNKNTYIPVRDRICEIFENILIQTYSSSHCNFSIKCSVVCGLKGAIRRDIPDIEILLMRCMKAISSICRIACQEIKQILLALAPCPKDENEQEPNNFRELLLLILELIEDVLESPTVAYLVNEHLNNLMVYIFFVMCKTLAQDEYFVMNETHYVDSTVEDDFSIRRVATNVLISLKNYYSKNNNISVFCNVLHQTIQLQLHQAFLTKQTSEIYFIKVFDSIIYAYGCLRSYSFESIEQFHIYVEQWSIFLTDIHTNWIIRGRLIWFAGKISLQLSAQMLDYHMTGLLSNFNDINIRWIAYQALRNHLSFGYCSGHKMVIAKHIDEIQHCLFLVNVNYEQIAITFLKSFRLIFRYCADTLHHVNIMKLLDIIIYIIHYHFSTIPVIEEVNYLIAYYLINNFVNIILDQIVPIAFNLIYKTYQPLQGRSNCVERGFELMNTFVKYYPGEILNTIIIQCFEASYKYLMEFDDTSDVEAAITILSNMLLKYEYSIRNVRDSKGKRLGEYVPTVILSILDITNEKYIPIRLAHLCVVGLISLPEFFQPYLEPILKSLITFLQRAQNKYQLTICYVIFSYMFVWQVENVINFLWNIPGPDGHSGLNFFINNWKIALLYSTKFDRIIMALGICKMIEFSLIGNDDRINSCTIVMETPNDGTCCGLERLYLLLIKLFILELEEEIDNPTINEDHDLDSELLKNHTICNMNIIQHIKTFLRNFNTIHYYNAYDKYIRRQELHAHYILEHGIQPRIQDSNNAVPPQEGM